MINNLLFKRKLKKFLIFNVLFIILAGISLTITLDENPNPKYIQGSGQVTFTVSNWGPPPANILIYEEGSSTVVGSATAVSDPQAITVTFNNLSEGTHRFRAEKVPVGGTIGSGELAAEIAELISYQQPAQISNFTANPDPVAGGQTVGISIEFNQDMDHNSPVTITITDANGNVFVVPAANITWTTARGLRVETVIPSTAAAGTATVGVAATNAAGTLVANPNAGTFRISTSASGSFSIVRPCPGNLNETLNTTQPTFEWTAPSGIQRTFLEFHRTANVGGAKPNPFTATFSVEASTNPFILPPGLLSSENSYYFRISGRDAGNNIITSEVSGRLTIDTRPIRLSQPASGAYTNWESPFWVEWSLQQPLITPSETSNWTFRLTMSNDPSFSTFTKEVRGLTTTRYDYTQAPGGKPTQGVWYIRVQAIDGRGNIDNTVIVQINVDTTAPTPPRLFKPDDGAFLNDPTPTFVWEQVADAKQYGFDIATDQAFSNLVGYACATVERGTSMTSVAYTPAAPLPEGQYWWRVRSIDESGNSTPPNMAYVRKLVIDRSPPEGTNIILDKPPHTARINDTTPVFVWHWNPNVTDDPSDGVEMNKAIIEITMSRAAWSKSLSPFYFTFEVTSDRNKYGWDPEHPHINNYFTYEKAPPLTRETKYYWRIRPIDSAGNVGVPSAINEFTLDTTPPAPPKILDPKNGDIVQFSVISVKLQTFPDPIVPNGPALTQKIRVYKVLGHTAPTKYNTVLIGGPLTLAPGQTSANLPVNLGNVDGTITLIATAEDDAGNESPFSASTPVTIVLDTKSPKIDHLVITSRHEGSPQAPQADSGNLILVQVIFSEQMKTKDSSNIEVHPTVTITPYTGIKIIEVKPLSSPNKAWSETGTTWTGYATIPAGTGYDGYATVSVSGNVTDLAGRKFKPNPTVYPEYFLIDTAPKLKIKAFYNPTDERDIIIGIESSEKLRMIPGVEVDFNAKIEQLIMNNVWDKMYVGTYTLPDSATGDIEITAYATDLSGNTGKAKYTFNIGTVNPYGGMIGNSDGEITLSMPGGSLARKATVALLPREMEIEGTTTQMKSSALGKAYTILNRQKDTGISQGLVTASKKAYDFGPYTLKFRKQYKIKAKVPELLKEYKDKTGICIYNCGKWHWLGKVKENETVETKAAVPGLIAFMADIKEPEVKETIPAEGEEISIQRPILKMKVLEHGSGLDIKNSCIKIDGRNIDFHFDENSSTILARPEYLEEGLHEVTVLLKDKTQNSSQKTFSITATGPFSVKEYFVYPTPVQSSDDFTIHYRLNQDAQEVYVKIYDSAGDLVIKLTDLPAGAGEQTYIWDMFNRRGRDVANGVYFLEMTAISASDSTQKVTLMTKTAILR